MSKKKQFSFDVWDHNMVPGVSIIEQKKFLRWFFLTLISAGVLILGLVLMDLPLYCALYDAYQNEYALKGQTLRFEELLQKKYVLKQEAQRLKDRESGFVKKRENKALLFEIIVFFKKNVSSNSILSSCVINSKQLYAVITGESLIELLSLYDVLVAKNDWFGKVIVHSLVQQSNEQGYIMTVKALLKNSHT